jgi:predicted secreted Zn-dependent protease
MIEALAAALIAIQGGYTMPSGAPPSPRASRPTQAPAPVLQPVVPAVPGKMLKDLPNATIRYFDVAGKNLKAINKSIARQQQPDSSGRAAVAPTSWAVDTTFNKVTSGGQCKITAAKATFSSTVTLPRLTSDKAHTPALLASWNNYLANIENTQAANLWFVYDRIRDVEKAILASSCEGAQAAGNAAVERLRAQAAEFQRASTTPAAPAK